MLRAMMRGWIIMMIMGFACSVFADNSPVINPRYLVNGDSVFDKSTELTWSRCSVGQRWKDGIGCYGATGKFTFDEAQHLSVGGWRVPTLNELRTLVVDGKFNPVFDTAAFPNADMQILGYWTSTPDSAAYAWYILFFDGRIDN